MAAASHSDQPRERASDGALAVVDSPLALIGNTPMVELSRVVPAGAARVFAKCEQANPGGSVKDRIALAMIEAAERAGRIAPDRSVIVEPTSGNTGIGLALVCAAKGYRLVLTMPESMSLERRALLESYGAELTLTPAALDMQGAVDRARALCAADDRWYMPDQFANPANPAVHRETTAREITAQLAAALDEFGEPAPACALVAGIGTGGTITGVGGVLRERFPGCRVFGVEPAASAVLAGGPPGLHRIQGIGAGFVPDVLDRGVITELRAVTDEDAYAMMRRLARQEGLLVGISAGANVAVACDVARELGRAHADAGGDGPAPWVVTVLCDTGERYFSMDEYFAEASA